MPPDAATGKPLSAIAEFRLVTADLSRLRRFYNEVLGFTIDGQERAIANDELALLGVHGSGLLQTMRLGGQRVSVDFYEGAGVGAETTFPKGAD